VPMWPPSPRAFFLSFKKIQALPYNPRLSLLHT
jgi:hypothetical protein